MAVEKHMTSSTLPPRPESSIPHLGTYVREMAVSVPRMYENALDWAHLPHLHASSFSRIELLEQDEFSWSARTWNAAPREAESSVIELRLDPTCRRWITRTLEGANAGSEIWTHCIPLGQRRLMVVVDFFAPAVASEKRERVGASYAALYARLYDEDERMMVQRQAALDTGQTDASALRTGTAADALASIDLGPMHSLAARLPLDITVGGRRFRVWQDNGQFLAYALNCPHALAPLDRVPIIASSLTCPWHGYCFDVRSGEQMAGGPGDAQCRLPVHRVYEDRNGQARLG